jgi:hypothetical protein
MHVCAPFLAARVCQPSCRFVGKAQHRRHKWLPSELLQMLLTCCFVKIAVSSADTTKTASTKYIPVGYNWNPSWIKFDTVGSELEPQLNFGIKLWSIC